MRTIVLNMFTLVIFNLIQINVLCTQTEISGISKTYAGEAFTLFVYSDYITKLEDTLAKGVVDSQGAFRLTFDLDETREVFLHLGIYYCYLYAEPGKAYEVILPEKTEKTQSEKLNPYFKETEVHLLVKDAKSDELNFNIRSFDQSYYPYYQKHVIDVVYNRDFSDLDSAISSMTIPYQTYNNEFFTSYQRYKLARLRYLANQKKSRNISDHFFLNQGVLYANPAYMELFNKVYENYFTYFGRTDTGKRIYDDISKAKSLSRLKTTLATDSVLANDTLKEFVIIKCIYDEFYKDKFSRNALLVVLDSLIQTTEIKEHKKIASQIMTKLTRLMPGYPPPQFTLFDKDSLLVSLSDFKGKYVYLNFCACMSYSCINEFEMIKELKSRLKDYITIITISLDENIGSMKRFLDRYPFDWVFLHYGNQPSVMSDYDIRGFPTYFLIGPDGNIILSPAPSPAEKFSDKLFEIMKKRGDIQLNPGETFELK